MTGAPVGSPGGDDRWSACWERGMRTELPPAELFDQLAALHGDVVVLHGLPVAGTSRVIDHVLVGPGGVVVAASEDRAGRVRSDGVRLRVAGRDCSSIVDLALWQAEVVRMTLAARGHAGVPVHGVLHWCDVDALGSRAVALRGVPLLSAGAATCMAAAGLDLSPLAVARITTVLATGRR